MAEIEYIVVGGVACLLHGAPSTTLDLDVVYRVGDDNLARLEASLRDLDARVRDPAGRDLVPNVRDVKPGGHLQLTTRHGPLDLLAALHDGRTFDDLAERSLLMEEEGLIVRVLDLPTLIEVKRSTGRARDLLVVPLLLALQQEGGSRE
jgi:hypothetical protein